MHIRIPSIEDGRQVAELARASGALDENSSYAYLLMCHHFRETCAVAERGGDVVGFVTGYIPPAQPGTWFVWQVAVAQSERGNGVAGKLLRSVLARDVCEDVRYLEATVTPSNAASQRLFRSFAHSNDAQCVETVLFERSAFGADGHEDEILYRIGPLNRAAVIESIENRSNVS